MITYLFKIDGAQEFEKKLTLLEMQVGKKVVRTAVRRGLKIFVAAAKRNVLALPAGPQRRLSGKIRNLIAKNLTVRKAKKQKSGSYTMLGLIRASDEFVHYRQGSYSYTYKKNGKTRHKTVGRSYIPAAIEYGHGSNKEAAARPFMRPAADATRYWVLAEFKKVVADGVKVAFR